MFASHRPNRPQDALQARRKRRRPRQPCHLYLEPLEDRCLLSNDVILDWNATLINAIEANRTSPLLASRGMAMVHVAMYDAVVAVEPAYTFYPVPGLADAPPPAAHAFPQVAAARAGQRRVLDRVLSGVDGDGLADILRGDALPAPAGRDERWGRKGAGGALAPSPYLTGPAWASGSQRRASAGGRALSPSPTRCGPANWPWDSTGQCKPWPRSGQRARARRLAPALPFPRLDSPVSTLRGKKEAPSTLSLSQRKCRPCLGSARAGRRVRRT
jgi:hypothetical protein